MILYKLYVFESLLSSCSSWSSVSLLTRVTSVKSVNVHSLTDCYVMFIIVTPPCFHITRIIIVNIVNIMILPLLYRLATTTSSYVSILDRVPLESHFHLGNLTYQILIFIIMMMGRLGSRMSWPRLHYDTNNHQPTHTSTHSTSSHTHTTCHKHTSTSTQAHKHTSTSTQAQVQLNIMAPTAVSLVVKALVWWQHLHSWLIDPQVQVSPIGGGRQELCSRSSPEEDCTKAV